MEVKTISGSIATCTGSVAFTFQMEVKTIIYEFERTPFGLHLHFKWKLKLSVLF